MIIKMSFFVYYNKYLLLLSLPTKNETVFQKVSIILMVYNFGCGLN